MFCEEAGRSPERAEEGYVLVFIGYLSLKRRVGPRLAPQYVSAVPRFHEDLGLE